MVINIGITGSSCSGKTTFAKMLASKFPNSVYLSQDSYYKSMPDNIQDLNDFNFDEPNRLDNEKLLDTIKRIKLGMDYLVPDYNFETGKVNGSTLHTNKDCEIIIIEGIFLFHDTDVTNEFDLKIFIDTNLEECLNRRLKRDQVCHGKFKYDDIINRWNRDVVPAYNNYIKSKKNEVDYIVDGNFKFDDNVNIIKKYINSNFFEKQ